MAVSSHTDSTPTPWRSPADLADLLAQSCADLRVPLGIDAEALRTAATETYRLSLMSEEGRDLRPQVCVLASDNIGRIAIQFSEFIPFEAEGVHKIAPCVPGGQFAFLVRATGPKVEAVGWLRTALHGLGTGANLESTGSRYEGGAWFRVVGPGAIEAWSTHLLQGERDEGIQFASGGFFRLSGGAIEIVRFSFEHAATLLGLIDKPTHALLRVIPLAQQARHGGAYVLLPEDADVAKTLAAEAGLFRSLRGLSVPASGSALSVATSVDLAALGDVKPPDMESLQQLNDEIRCIADLSAADGCVVLARPLRPVAFAAQIAAEVDGRIPGEDMGPVRSGAVDFSRIPGTRHGSAARLCHKLRGTTVIVISQDGGVTLFRSLAIGPVQRFGPFLHVPTYKFYGATE